MKNNILYKDFDVEKFKRVAKKDLWGQFEAVIDSMIRSVNENHGDDSPYITIDFSSQKLAKGDRSCVDTDWHTDGKDSNIYAFYQIGPQRTIFKDSGNNELMIPEGEIFLYNSTDEHRGFRASCATERLFIRVCASNYIQPKNRLIKK